MAAQLRHARNTMAKPVEHMSGNLLLDANPQKKKLSFLVSLSVHCAPFLADAALSAHDDDEQNRGNRR